MFLGIFLVPITTIAMKLKFPNVPYSTLFLIFVILLVAERAWETFFSAKEHKHHKLHGDWTLPIVSIAYLVMLFGTIWEFFIIQRQQNTLISITGILIFLFSLFLRILCIKTLKDQWSVHAVGAKKIKAPSLVNTGPYRYVRHPIYLGVILEVLSIPLIWNAYFYFLFALIVNVPLQILRAYFEENSTIRKLGNEYIKYKNSVPAFFPFKLK